MVWEGHRSNKRIKRHKRMDDKGKKFAAESGLPAIYDLDAEAARLNDISEKVKLRKFSYSGHSDRVVPLVKLRKYAMALMIEASNAIDKEKTDLVEVKMNNIVQEQRRSHESIVAQMRLQHQIKMRELDSARECVDRERMALAELRVSHERAVQELAYARAAREAKVPSASPGTVDPQSFTSDAPNPDATQDDNMCQICFERSRDSVIMTCMHFQYCNRCLELHTLRDGKCPTCRQRISGILKLRS